ncbi:hypothetical protein EPA93_18725 [Ktedonosporobacter rubrisoli]|uniref:Uncharacterized protein n=1 Tax=Ktedonosporobacter rubrisoli TaxID=2509675 RepID=A0A4P6JR46_KTERU|nr:DUF5682 family protein [Ktedonosporobacter rubrisoli]QBD77919.1 hypothetical protein EPA93_18725 [Ktedonosporobacter rubrisoli]
MSIHVFGIRHHGPGCARSLRTALEALQPDIVLVEGPPDAQEILPLLVHSDMKPPVAMLIFAAENPKKAVYYPFTTFSPEWQALQYALQQNIAARFIDLPQEIQLARLSEQAAQLEIPKEEPEAEPVTAEPAEPALPQKETLREDPFALLAQAAGYEDHELWWELQIEQRRDAQNFFEAILEAMSALRAEFPLLHEDDALREAHMRKMIREAQQEGFQRVAVVCGAWHAPVLADLEDEKADTALLKGLKRVAVNATWIPWTNSRLAYRSGYGAGITSPGWYEHLWAFPDGSVVRWIANAAGLLRGQDLDVSSASVIEAVRLGEALAALRNLPMAGLAELHEAIKTVLCHGDAAPMSLIREKLEINEKLGQVPTEATVVPLQYDLEARQRALRLKPTVEKTELDLDLRKELDRARSQLLHRLRLLNIEWGKPQAVRGKMGTFHEHWQLQWRVEFIVTLIEANIWGNTIESAATAYVSHEAEAAQELPQLTELLDLAILAELPGAVDKLLENIQRCSAASSDVQHLMEAMPPLARVARYSDVRQTRAEHIVPIIDGLFERVVISLPGACSSLDDDAARKMFACIDKVHGSVSLLNRDGQREEWQALLRSLMQREGIHGLIRGRCCRLLLEMRVLDEEELQRFTRLALSPAVEGMQAASWIEGLLHGSGLLVIHQDELWRALDHWLCELPADTFSLLLPILRRAFADFSAPERRQMGEKVKQLYTDSANKQIGMGKEQMQVNQERAELVLPILAQIMGVSIDGH